MDDLKDTIEYLEQRRDKALDYFIDKVKNYKLYSDEDLHKSLNVVLTICRQLKTIEDSAMIYNIYKKEEDETDYYDYYHGGLA